jgi:RHS repeat-associated protein
VRTYNRKIFNRCCLTPAFLWLVIGLHINCYGQVSLTGPTSVIIGSSYTYYPAYNNSSSYTYNGSYNYYITGGVVSGTTNTNKSGTCTSALYSIGINVTWTSSTGTLSFTSSLGSASKNITAVAALSPGTISPSSQSINYGFASATLTCTAATGGAVSPSYSYQWQSSPDNVNWTNISGATALNYSPGLMYTTTYFRRMVTETTTSTVAYTTSVIAAVYPQLSCTIAPTPQNITSGSGATPLTPTVSGGNSVYTYQWQSSPDGSTWTNVATTATYSPGILVSTTYYRLIVTSNGANITSNIATVTVTALPTGVLSISATTPSGNGSINTLSCAASGGNGTYAYAWYYSTNGGSSYQLISGATSATYTTGVITATTLYYVTVTSGGNNANSNTVSITMPSVPTISASSATLCNGATATLTATGGSGSYKWYNSSNTLLGTGSTYSTTSAGTYYAVSYNAYGISGSSNTVSIAAFNSPVAAPILGSTNCVLGSSAQLADATSGGIWSSNNTAVLKTDINGVVTGVSAGSATITYTVTNACGTSSQQLGITVIPFSSLSSSLGRGIDDPVITDTISLVQNTVKTTQFQQDTLYSSAHTIRNVIALKLVEETPLYIPGDFSATAVVKVEYGHSPNDIYQVDSTNLTVSYIKNGGNKYDAIKYFSFNNAEFIRVTVVRVVAPQTVGGVSFDTKQVLVLSNSLMGTRYYQLADNKKPVLSITNPSGGSVPDALAVSWVYPAHTNNNYTQLEWAWLENEMSSAYMNGSSLDTSLLFKNNATRLDLPGSSVAGGYNIPLLWGGVGKLYIRVRAVNMMPSGTRSDGPWSGIQTFAFNGHNDSLNWQMTTTYAEEGKRKTVIQYFDGSLRSRQTVTKDNTTMTTVVAESFYDGQGRPAIQILPAPGINNIIAYTKNLNKFYNQPDNTNPIDYFDFTTVSSGKYATTPLSTASGSSLYYSSLNPELNGATYNKNIPSTNGFAYAVTRYTPDATGRIMMQGGVGDSLQIGGSHATRYYYGSAAQEELDALFGTEVGNYTHYFKNMVQDANGQMSVSYVDMHGRTVATALAGESPTSLQALPITDTTQYKNQAGKVMTRNLLDNGSNILKGSSIESINTILVPFKALYSFNYNLSKQTLQMPACSGGTVTYNCKFDLQISISDVSGDTSAFVYSYPGIDTINFQTSIVLPAGSYSVRKTLTINPDSMAKFIQQYDSSGVGLCRTQQVLTDSLAALDSTASGCSVVSIPLTISGCLVSVGNYPAYLLNYATSIGLTDTTQLTSAQKLDVRNQYLSDSSFCISLNGNTSHTLDNIQRQMLLDMVPYSGQYARDTGTVAMALKYNIFSTSGAGMYTKPLYKYPRNSALTVDNYYDAFGRVDTTVSLAKLNTMSAGDFEGSFANSWAGSLLPYHPEFNKLIYAQTNLQAAYNFIDSLNQTVTVAFSPIAADPFFSVISTGADKDSITKYSNVNWQGGNSMWQIAYAEAFGCKTYVDTSNRKACLSNMPLQYTATGTVVNNGVSAVTLSASMQLQAWNMFKGFYSQVRGEMVNKYICLHTDTTDNRNLINQGFRIYFPYNNVQQSQNAGWTAWYPGQNGTYPAVSLKDSVTTYSTHCDSYINAWRLALLQCPSLPADSLTREHVVASITGKMLQVCMYGTDGGNPYGSSTVAPAYSGAPFTSFEQAVNFVFDSLGIPRSLQCNPYVIEYPKPYGNNAIVTTQQTSGIDTCTCSQFAKLTVEITAAGYNASSLTSVNQYLSLTYKDTLTAALFAGLQTCSGQYYLNNCRYKDSLVYNIKSGQYDHMTFTTCDTLYTLPLPSPQPLPAFLGCGFTKSTYSCYNCARFQSLDTSFFSIFGKHPVFTGTISNDTVVAYNSLFAKYVNFKTGLQHSWQYYADNFTTTGCAVGGISGTGAGLSICLNSSVLTDTTGLLQPQAPCQQVRNRAGIKGALLYDITQQKLIADFQAAYQAKCVSATELFKVTDTIKEYHYTLYYYDQAGSLIKTVPPKGVNPIYRQSFIDSVETFKANGTSLTPAHSLITRYCYNSLNQVNIQKSPDGGVSKFWYDRLGRLTLSQNAKQSGSGNVYSYTLYDSMGRITQVGQITGGSAMTDVTAKNDADLLAWLSGASSTRNQITQTVYDTAYSPINGLFLSQQNLRNRVSYSQLTNNATDAYPASASYYSYDIHGNVDTLLQDYGNSTGIANAMNTSGNRFKKLVYNYDLISGKVNQVSYQPGQADAYYHRYMYDGENRITDVFSGKDSVMLLLFPEREGHYYYYKHGPLARTELGQLRVQGLDYAYTLQGWLKGINPTMGGTLANGTDTTEAFPVAQDVYGFSLNYSNNDYRAIGFTPQATSVLGALGTNAAPLFNGNIAAMAVKIPVLGATKLYNYHYDQLNRIVSMDVFNGLNPVAGTFTPVSVSDYQERVSYDPNGNILTYLRNGDAARLSMDNLSYSYNTGTNQLQKVTDAAADASAGNYPLYNDIKQGQTNNNYQYDAIGNLVYDGSESITAISWSVYGKITSITKSGATIKYVYDASGNRIMKQTSADTTVYVRDAGGNVMSVYEKKAGQTLQQTEMHLYGSSRLGMTTQHMEPDSSLALQGGFGTAIKSTFTRGEKLFELTNHLGNVLVTITDRRVQNSSGGVTVDYYAADIMTANDYYPFGMPMPSRNFTATNAYRYGFNGKENDNEVKGTGNEQDYGMRIYDPRVGRFLSVDPITKSYPWLTPYQFASNTPIQAIDLDGKEAFFIHGTASGPKAWTPKLTNFIVKNLTNNIHSDATFSWQDRNGYLNNETDRKNAAFDLVLHIMDFRQKNRITDEEITLIGHSHGGNVAIQAAHYLNDIYGISVNIVDFNTPAYNGSKDPENPQVGYGINQLIQFWTKQDCVAGGLAGEDKYKDGVRTDIKNIELDKPLKNGLLESHFLENINLDELNSKKVKPTPVPSWDANPTHDKYDPNWKPPGGTTNSSTNTKPNSNSISTSATSQ